MNCIYFLLLWIKALCLFNTHPCHHSSLTLISSLSLSAALPFRDVEQRQPGGPDVYGQPQPTPRGQATWSGCTEWWKRTLTAYREASWQVACLFVSLKEPYNSAFRPWDVFFFFCPSQVFCCSGGRGGQEGGCTSQRSVREPAPTLPRWYSCRGGADIQQSQRPIPGVYMEPDDQHCVRNFMSHPIERLKLSVNLKFHFTFLFRIVFG